MSAAVAATARARSRVNPPEASSSTGRLPPFDDTAHWLYTVVFDGRDLWGPQSEPGLQVSVDAWEPYLEPAA